MRTGGSFDPPGVPVGMTADGLQRLTNSYRNLTSSLENLLSLEHGGIWSAFV